MTLVIGSSARIVHPPLDKCKTIAEFDIKGSGSALNTPQTAGDHREFFASQNHHIRL